MDPKLDERSRKCQQKLHELLCIDIKILDKLDELEKSLDEYSQKHKQFKIISILSKVGGATLIIGSVAAIPFTAGRSTAGIVTGVALCNVVDQVRSQTIFRKAENEINKKIMEFEELARQHDRFNTKFQLELNNFVELLNECQAENLSLHPTKSTSLTMTMIQSFLALDVLTYVKPHITKFVQTMATTNGLSVKTASSLMNISWLALADAVVILINCFNQLKKLNEPHPLKNKIIELRQKVKNEKKELETRLDFFDRICILEADFFSDSHSV